MHTAEFRQLQREHVFDTGKIEQLWQVARTASTVTEKGDSIIAALKAERPCPNCGSHPCPPGSSSKCCMSTDELPNIPSAIRPAMALFVEQHGNPYQAKAANA